MGLEGVEIVIATEETFGIAIADSDAEQVTTPHMLIELVQKAVKSSLKKRPCFSQRSFHRVRKKLAECTAFTRRSITLETHLSSLFPKPYRQRNWNRFRSVSGLSELPKLNWGRGVFFSPKCVRDLIPYESKRMAAKLTESNDWTDEEVRSVVRMIISEVLDVQRFSDHDNFVSDLGMD